MLLIDVLLVLGVSSPLRGAPITANWIATQLAVYATLLMLGPYQRVSIRGRRLGFIRLHRGESGPDIEALFRDGLRRAKYATFVFWALIVTMAWLGITQPL